jgi:heterodisulfide reductase subunit A-like polyferredoxin
VLNDAGYFPVQIISESYLHAMALEVGRLRGACSWAHSASSASLVARGRSNSNELKKQE